MYTVYIHKGFVERRLIWCHTHATVLFDFVSRRCCNSAITIQEDRGWNWSLVPNDSTRTRLYLLFCRPFRGSAREAQFRTVRSVLLNSDGNISKP